MINAHQHLEPTKASFAGLQLWPWEGSGGIDGEDGGHDEVEREARVLINGTRLLEGLTELVGGALGC